MGPSTYGISLTLEIHRLRFSPFNLGQVFSLLLFLSFIVLKIVTELSKIPLKFLSVLFWILSLLVSYDITSGDKIEESCNLPNSFICLRRRMNYQFIRACI